MNRGATNWWPLVALCLSAIPAGWGISPAPPAARVPVLTPAVIAAWEQAGAVFGWTSIGPQGDWRFDQDEPPAGALPAFRFSRFPAAKVPTLPSPDAPFGLWLGRGVTDADLKALAGLKQLRALNFESPYTYGVTDAGLKELAGLNKLQWLSLPGRVSDEGIRELQKALPQAIITASRPPFIM